MSCNPADRQSLKDASPGKAVFDDANCALCHGKDAKGTERAPELTALSAHYTKKKLVEYLSDPDGYIKNDPRLARAQSGFSGSMPSFRYLGSERLNVLAEFLLTLE